MYNKGYFQTILNDIKQEGLWKEENIITTEQNSTIDTNKFKNILNFCANNYLGLSNNKKVIKAAQNSYNSFGYGLSSVRFICGTQTIHKDLENAVSNFLKTEDTILYNSCFDANGGLFATITSPEDAIISDSLNHASIIDGVRLSKAKVFRYENNDMQDLEKCLTEADSFGAKQKIIVTDGVFSMDGIIANLKGICALAEKYNALVVVDDSHATGVIGATGKGSIEYCDVMGRVDIITGTFGKALGGANGGFTSGRKEIIELLRQRSRPYLFSNTLAPSICAATLKVLEMLSNDTTILSKLTENAKYFRRKMTEEGFNLIGKSHAIIPIMLYDAILSQKVAEKMLNKGIYVIGFYYPVVPKNEARIRVQISAAHSKADIDKCVNAFIETRNELKF